MRAFYKVFRWVILAVLVLLIFVALRKPAPPTLPVAPESAKVNLQSFNDKLDQLSESHARGESGQARFSADEVNSYVAQSMSEQQPAPSPRATSQPAPSAAPQSVAAATPDNPPPVRTVQVGFLNDQITGQFATELYGKEIYVTISGHLGAKDGYATFDPTAFKVGDFEVPVAWVNDALQRKLAEPENREKLKLPEYVRDLRVENGELVVTEK